jgi:hypothetical protein
MRQSLSALLLASFACSAPAPRSGSSGDQATISDSAGVTIVQNHRPVWGDGEGWRVSAEPLLLIDDEAALGRGKYVIAAARLSDGEIVVLSDAGGQWLDADGRPLRPFALRGEGPGEFRYPHELLVLDGDTVAVASLGFRAKVGLFAADGTPIREFHGSPEAFAALGSWEECEMYLLPDLSTTGCRYDPTIPYSDTYRSAFDRDGNYVGHGSGVLRDQRRTYRVPPAQDTSIALGIDIGVEQQIIDIPPGHGTSIIHPFHSQSFLAYGDSPYRVAIATNPHWEIELWTPDGKLELRIRRDGGRRTATEAERREAQRMIDDTAGHVIRPAPGLSMEEQKSMLIWPDSLPGHAGLAMTPDGMVLSRQFSLDNVHSRSVFEVFDRSGRWLGNISLPPRFRLLEAGRDYMLGVQYDEDDVPRLAVYGVDRGK